MNNYIILVMENIKKFIGTKKGKIIVLSSVSIFLLIIIIVVIGVSYKNSSGGIVPNGKHKWDPFNPSTHKKTPLKPLSPSTPIPTNGKINFNSMNIFTSKKTYWDTGIHLAYFPTYYKYSLTSKNTTIFSNGGLYYTDGMRTHGFGNIITKINFQYNKNNNELFNVLSVYSVIKIDPKTNLGMSLDHTTTLNTDELTNINNKISTKINPLLSKLKQGQKLIISGINYYYNFTILSHGQIWADRVQANVLININSLDYSIVNK